MPIAFTACPYDLIHLHGMDVRTAARRLRLTPSAVLERVAARTAEIREERYREASRLGDLADRERREARERRLRVEAERQGAAEAASAARAAQMAAEARERCPYDLVHGRGVPLRTAARRLGISVPEALARIAVRVAEIRESQHRAACDVDVDDAPPSLEVSWHRRHRGQSRDRAWQLWRAGVPAEAIGERLGLEEGAVYQLVREASRSAHAPDHDDAADDVDV